MVVEEEEGSGEDRRSNVGCDRGLERRGSSSTLVLGSTGLTWSGTPFLLIERDPKRRDISCGVPKMCWDPNKQEQINDVNEIGKFRIGNLLNINLKPGPHYHVSLPELTPHHVWSIPVRPLHLIGQYWSRASWDGP